MDVQQQRCNYQSPFRSKLDRQHRFYDGWADRQSEDKTPIPPQPTKKRILSQSSALDEKASDAPLIQSRNPTPVRSGVQSATPQDIPQRVPSPHSALPPLLSTLPEPRLSRPVEVKDLLNPISRDKTGASDRQHDGEGTVSQWTVPMAATSGPTTPSLPLTSMRKELLGDVTLPSSSPALMKTYPHPLSQSLTPASPISYRSGLITTGLSTATIDLQQSPFVLPRGQASASVGSGPLLPMETTIAPSIPPAAHVSSPPPRRTSPPSALLQVASTGEPRSFFSAPILFGEKGFNVPTSGASGQIQYQSMTLETEEGPIQVPVDVQAASKIADEKRKRNTIASHRFRQRRKEREQETSNNISSLKAQVREMTEDKEYYQRERDILLDVLQRNNIAIPPRPPPPRQIRHASLGGSQDQDMGTPAPNGGRNTRRRTSEYVSPQWQHPHTVAPMLPFERIPTVPSEHIQILQQRSQPQVLFDPNTKPSEATAPQ